MVAHLHQQGMYYFVYNFVVGGVTPSKESEGGKEKVPDRIFKE